VLAKFSVERMLAPQIAAKFYKAVVQAVLLYGSETWNLTKLALARLKGFHVCATYKMAREHWPKRGANGVWVYPKTARMRHGFHCQVHPDPLSDDHVVRGNETDLYGLRWRQTAERVNAASVVVGAADVLGRNRRCNWI
jgi:hypothetical protein